LTEEQQNHTLIEEQQPQSYCDLPSLFQAYARRVFHYHYARVQNLHEAEDLTSQTFLAAWEQWHNLRDPAKAVSWLFSIARNKSSDYFSNRQHIQHDELNDELTGSANPMYAEILDRWLDLQRHIERLTEKQQDLVRLRLVAELPFKQISTIMREPEIRIKKRYYRLLERLKAQMEQE